MALAYVAGLLAERGLRIVAVDLDLEAPGLHAVLGVNNVEDGRGTLALLRKVVFREGELEIDASVVLKDYGRGAIVKVIPAGPVTRRYLAALEEMHIPAWHLREGASPLMTLVEQIRDATEAQAVLMDCRTGLSEIAAAAIFHVADLVVAVLPLTEQTLEGLPVLLDGIRAARSHREGRPGLLLVPSMVPDGPEGDLLRRDYVQRFREAYADHLLSGGGDLGTDADDAAATAPVLERGIDYRRGVALVGRVEGEYWRRLAAPYEPLAAHIAKSWENNAGNADTKLVEVDAAKVLRELDIDTETAFAEFAPRAKVVDLFVRPADFADLLDRQTFFVVGAKGAGKTWLWRYLLLSQTGPGEALPGERRQYAAGHEPTDDDARELGTTALKLSKASFRELEKACGLARAGTYEALWHFYALARLFNAFPQIVEPVADTVSGPERALIRGLAKGTPRKAFEKVLKYASAGTLAEGAIRAADLALAEANLGPITLLYDGLDTDFDDGERRQRFAGALTGVVYDLRGVLKRIGFKVFLREDVFLELPNQNRSHFDAAKVELRWAASDLWRMTLKLAASSATFSEAVRRVDPSVVSPLLCADEKLVDLLEPLWGKTIEGGNKASTAGYVERRISDGKRRLFPRTLVQLLAAAVTEEKRLGVPHRSDRVLRSTALQKGVERASEQRLADLRAEYTELRPYLQALGGMKPTGTAAEIQGHLERGLKRMRGGGPPPTLHRGPRGWVGVVERLLEVGVLAEYQRARGPAGEKKYQVALLYRPAIGIRLVGTV
jgi:MinD-like ATPase involved in chromosome partitioning or flagellar assembly